MPELPEVETVKRGLARELAGARIERVEVLRPESVAYPSALSFCRGLAGHQIEGIKRRGKYLYFVLDRAAHLVVHLRMSGRLILSRRRQAHHRHRRVSFRFAHGRELGFEDVRVFGRLWYVPGGRALGQIVPALAELGPEPLPEIAPEHLAQCFAGKKQPVKAALLDQRNLAGLGNIYADESLFAAGIHPLRPTGSLSRQELEVLAVSIPAILEDAIANSGTTLRDYADSNGQRGSYQLQALVYGRGGKPCRACSSAIARIRIAGRSSHFCSRCQR